MRQKPLVSLAMAMANRIAQGKAQGVSWCVGEIELTEALIIIVNAVICPDPLMSDYL
jgi:hypothetical protein